VITDGRKLFIENVPSVEVPVAKDQRIFIKMKGL